MLAFRQLFRAMSFFRTLRARYLFLVLAIGFFLVGAWLPSATKGVFASPDETATAVITSMIAAEGRAIQEEPLSVQVPWLHPRSWVSEGNAIVPVGFLGWSLLLSPLVWLFGKSILPWMGLLLTLSAIYPVFSLLRRRFSESSAWMGTALLFFFPSVVLYANRGLFANLPQLALFAWWLFLVSSQEESEKSFRAFQNGREVLKGALMIFVVILRPVEGIWLIPWMWWWAHKTTWTRRRFWLQFTGTLIAISLYALVVYRTYGDAFAIGYLLRDNALPMIEGVSTQKGGANNIPLSWQDILPYGFHPRHIWWNISSFTKEILWPWFLAILCLWAPLGVSLWERLREEGWKCWTLSKITFRSIVPVLLSFWTVIVLLAIYGSGLYADHIRPGAITIGNSFLRYSLPLVPLWLYLFLLGVEKQRASKQGRLISSLAVLLLLGAGLFFVFAKDDEGLLATRTELFRYTAIREVASKLFPSKSIILSDRSDKIFFPVLRVVSPLPSLEERVRLTQLPGVTVGLFSRPLSQAERDAWRVAGVTPQELQSFGRERLYRLVPLAP